MRVYCRLAEIMRERQLTIAALQRLARVGKETIIALRRNCWKQVNRRAIAAICGALGLTLDELFTLLEENIWFPILLHREVTIHIGSSSLLSPHTPAPARTLNPGFADMWDMRAVFAICDHLRRLAPDIRVHFREHMNGGVPGESTSDDAAQAFNSGNHIVIGSPTSNRFAEEIVARAFGVPPFTPRMRSHFPYNLVTRRGLGAPSSFGRQQPTGPLGIAATRDGKLVARYNLVPQGEGEDCALIVVRRIRRPPALRRLGHDDESIIIAMFGHDGLGAFACAQVAVCNRYAEALYPPHPNQPWMRVVAVKYERPPVSRAGDRQHDNRRITFAHIVSENETPEDATTPDRTVGASGAPVGKTRPRMPDRCGAGGLLQTWDKDWDGCSGVTEGTPRG